MKQKKDRVIMLVDCQSFYASVEKAIYPQYENKPLVVSGDPSRRSGIILAACPLAKGFGVKTAESLGEALGKCPELIVMRPKMQTYIDVSLQITEIYKTFTDQMEIFSIDESFLDLTSSSHFFNHDIVLMAKTIQQKVKAQTGIHTRFGISNTKVLAKTACDNFAKKNKDGIYIMTPERVKNELWALPIDKMYMVGSRMTAHFLRLGIYTIGQLAQMELGDVKAKMRSRMGKNADIQAELYWRIANGFDDSPVSPNSLQHDQKAIGHQMTLPIDYRRRSDLYVVLEELSEQVCRRCRTKGFMGSVVSVGCQGADFDRRSGFYRQMKIGEPTNITKEVYEAVKILFDRHWDEQPVRKVGVTLSSLIRQEEMQLFLFSDRHRMQQLEKATDAIKDRFGETAILKASSLTAAGQAHERSMKIGGHSI